MPASQTPKEVKQFLGLIGYYRKFIPKFSDIARPLTNLTKKDVPYEWTPECTKMFEIVRSNLNTHLLDTPFAIRQPIWRPCLLERVFKPICTPALVWSFSTESTRDRVYVGREESACPCAVLWC